MPPDNAGAEAVRRAVACGEFPKALALWEDYADLLRREVRRGEFSAEKLAETRDLAEWCRVTALCARSHAQSQLNSICAVQQYLCASPQAKPRISTSA